MSRVKHALRFCALLSLFGLSACGGGANPFFREAQIDVMANTDGWIVLDAVKHQPPLHEKGIESILLLYQPDHRLELVHVGLTIFENDHFVSTSDEIVPRAYVESLFLDHISDAGYIRAQTNSRWNEKIEPHIDWSRFRGWDGEYFIDDSGKDVLANLRGEGFDAILYVKENFSGDFMGGTREPIGSKGLYHRTNSSAYAAFELSMIDTQSGDEIGGRSYTQGSGKLMPNLEWKEEFDNYSEEEKAAIAQAVRKRVENNVQQALRMLKIIPVEGSQFLKANAS